MLNIKAIKDKFYILVWSVDYRMLNIKTIKDKFYILVWRNS